MKKRVLCAFLAASMLLGLTACNGEKKGDSLVVKEGIPTYEDNQQIELAAYCGPRRGGYRFYNGEYGIHPNDAPGGWDGWWSEQDFQDYIDCGFTYLLPEADAFYDYTYTNGKNQKANEFEDSDLYTFMQMAEKMNIPVVVSCQRLNSLSSSTDHRLSDDNKAFLSQMVNDLSAYKTFKGFTFRDEPWIESVRAFESVWSYLKELKSDLYFFTSCFPIYVSDMKALTLEGADSKEEAYKSYVEAFAKANGTFAYDSYPLWEDPVVGTTYLDATWFQNLRIVAESAKENEFDAGITIQSTTWGNPKGRYNTAHNREVKTKADVGFQMYTALAYGMKYVNYYTYWQHWSDGDGGIHYSAMMNYPENKGEAPIKTDAYYAVKEVNLEVKKFDHVFLNYDWQGTMQVVPEGKKASTVLAHVGDYKNARIASATATEEAIIGCMKDADGYDGYWVVNATDPGQNKTNSVTVEFKQATKAIAYIQGEETEITLKDGKYTFELASGDGVFVIPIK